MKKRILLSASIFLLCVPAGRIAAQHVTQGVEENYDNVLNTPSEELSPEALTKKYDFLNLTYQSYYLENGVMKSSVTKEDIVAHGLPATFYDRLCHELENNNYSFRHLGMSIENWPTEKPSVKTREEMRLYRPWFYPEELLTEEEKATRKKLMALISPDTKYIDGDKMASRLTEKDFLNAGLPAFYYRAMLDDLNLSNNYDRLYYPKKEDRIQALKEELEAVRAQWQQLQDM